MYEKNNIGLCLAAIDLVKQGGAYSEHSRVGNEQIADCQGFVELAMQAIGLDRKDYTGSNAMLRQMVHSVREINQNNMMAGDIVFWVRKDDKEHEKYKAGGHRYVAEFEGWNATHVGIYLGNGYIAESASSIGHWAITELKKRGATHYAKHKSLEYVSDRENEVLQAILALNSTDTKQNTTTEQTNDTQAGTSKAKIAYIEYKADFQHLRAKADRGSTSLAMLANGTEIEVLKADVGHGWSKIKYGNMIGYVYRGAYKLGRSPYTAVNEVQHIEVAEDVQVYEDGFVDKNNLNVLERLEHLENENAELKYRLMEIENFIGMSVG